MFKGILNQVQTYEAGKPIELVMREYGIGQADIIKLGSNENPYGTSPRALEAIRSHAHHACFYPDDSMLELKTALCTHYRIKQSEIIIGSGSDQIIEFCLQALEHHNACVITAKTTFAMYGVYAKLAGVEVCTTQSDMHCLSEFQSLIMQKKHEGVRVSAIFVCAPNNPLGECIDSNELWNFLEFVESESAHSLVVIDGAYQEFAAFKDKRKALCVHDIMARFGNVVYLGTFSKLYGLGGMRVGYGIGSEKVMRALYKVRPPFNVGVLSLVAATAALGDKEFITHTLESNLAEMSRYEKFAEDIGLRFIPSFANFITLFPAQDSQIDCTQVSEWLLHRGVIVRNLRSYGLNALRITIGTQEQNTRVFELMHSCMRTR